MHRVLSLVHEKRVSVHPLDIQASNRGTRKNGLEMDAMSEKKVMTTNTGKPIDNDLNSMTAGPKGPALVQDVQLIEKMAHFDRERIPERVVHAKCAGAGGYFEVTHDITKYICLVVGRGLRTLPKSTSFSKSVANVQDIFIRS